MPCDDPEWSNFTKFFAQNFSKFGVKKLISTSYAEDSKTTPGMYQLTLFEEDSPKFDKTKTKTHGKIFTLSRDKNKEKVNLDDLDWEYLEGNGDFRSEEVTKLRDEADIIITNPPFSLFGEFYQWLQKSKKEFLIISNINALSNPDVFSGIQENIIWLGNNTVRYFIQPDGSLYETARTYWLTNLDHGKRHEELQLMTMEDNIKYSRRNQVRGKPYEKYVNFEGIEVPYTEAIPSDYEGNMGVPITFIDKYNPAQFEIVGKSDWLAQPVLIDGKLRENPGRFYIRKDNKLIRKYERIVIRKKKTDEN